MPLEFSLKLEEIPVKLITSSGQVKEYKLIEMDGERRGAYTEASSSLMEVEDGRVKKILSYKKMDVLLLSYCLFGPDGKLVSEEELLSYPASVLEQLRKEARKLNKLDEEDRQKIKNE